MQNDIKSVDIDQNQSKILEIAPIGKGKRFLLFWADYFLSFIYVLFYTISLLFLLDMSFLNMIKKAMFQQHTKI